MKKFEIGKTYYTHAVWDKNFIFPYTIQKRTEKNAVICDMNGNQKRRKIRSIDDVEYIEIDSTSTPRVIRADLEYIAKEKEA